MLYLDHAQCSRRGAVTPLAALLSAVLLGMVACAVDIGWMVLVKADLQNAADAAALAGVKPLMDGYVNYSLTTSSTTKTTIMTAAMASAKTKCITYAGYNSAGGVSSLSLNNGDIEFGFTDASGNYTALAGTSPFPNTVKVTLRRDATANGSLGLFFAPIFGLKSINLVASAAATMYGGVAEGFSSNPSSNVFVMPMTYDVNSWNTFTATGLDPDASLTTYNGNPALQVYPSIKAYGNFGQLSLNDGHVGARTEIDWVNGGIGADEIQALADSQLIPLSSHDSTRWDWQGDTGLKQSLISAINQQAGKQFVLPLYTPYNNGVPNAEDYMAGTDNGSHYNFNIVKFVGVAVVPSDQSVVVQPVAMVNPNVVFSGGNPVPIGTGSATGLVTIFAAPRLSQ